MMKSPDEKRSKKWHWPFLRINSGGDKEYACRHGVGHGGMHGCDGCCADADFPDLKNTNELAAICRDRASEIKTLREENERLSNAEYLLSCVLCYATGGKLSKTDYAQSTCYSAIDEHYDSLHENLEARLNNLNNTLDRLQNKLTAYESYRVFKIPAEWRDVPESDPVMEIDAVRVFSELETLKAQLEIAKEALQRIGELLVMDDGNVKDIGWHVLLLTKIQAEQMKSLSKIRGKQ